MCINVYFVRNVVLADLKPRITLSSPPNDVRRIIRACARFRAYTCIHHTCIHRLEYLFIRAFGREIVPFIVCFTPRDNHIVYTLYVLLLYFELFFFLVISSYYRNGKSFSFFNIRIRDIPLCFVFGYSTGFKKKFFFLYV